MGQMLSHKQELIRINTKKNSIEYSNNNGLSWHHRFTGTVMMGVLQDIMDNGEEILLTTTKGIYYSKTKGSSWHKRS
jgi:hypothetical protein